MLRLTILTLDGVKYDEAVYEVILPTMDGQIGVFTGHSQIVTQAKEGIIFARVKLGDPDDFMESFVCHGGVIEVEDDVVSVLSDEASSSDELIEAEEKQAYEQAIKLRADAKDQVSLDKAQSMIDRHAVRLQVAGLRKNRNRR